MSDVNEVDPNSNLNWDKIPFYRKQQFVGLFLIIFYPITFLLTISGPVYFKKKNEIKKWGIATKLIVVTLCLFVSAINILLFSTPKDRPANTMHQSDRNIENKDIIKIKASNNELPDCTEKSVERTLKRIISKNVEVLGIKNMRNVNLKQETDGPKVEALIMYLMSNGIMNPDLSDTNAKGKMIQDNKICAAHIFTAQGDEDFYYVLKWMDRGAGEWLVQVVG